MRITVPPADARIALDQINLADTDLYTKRDAHLVWRTMRAEQPVFWQKPANGPGFWAVTRHADVRRVLAEHRTFSSEGGTAIAMLEGRDPAAGIMMQATDPPRHRQFREHLERPFTRSCVADQTAFIRAYVRDAIEPVLDGAEVDLAVVFGALPMAVGARMMDLPVADVQPLLRLAYASLAPDDPRYQTPGVPVPNAAYAHFEIVTYFARRLAERRKSPGGDLISHLIAAEVDGRRLTEQELLANCLSLLLGAVVTTSHVISATVIALTEAGRGEGRWPDHPSTSTLVEEALRWSSPVTHFMRRARCDTEINGQHISAGDAVTAWIASANRDESTFARAFELDFSRVPNRHVAFGAGPHICLGRNLARLMLENAFDQLIASVEAFELAGAPVHLASNEIAGVVSLPVRMKPRPGRSTAAAHRSNAPG
jgi:cytochrome P450